MAASGRTASTLVAFVWGMSRWDRALLPPAQALGWLVVGMLGAVITFPLVVLRGAPGLGLLCGAAVALGELLFSRPRIRNRFGNRHVSEADVVVQSLGGGLVGCGIGGALAHLGGLPPAAGAIVGGLLLAAVTRPSVRAEDETRFRTLVQSPPDHVEAVRAERFVRRLLESAGNPSRERVLLTINLIYAIMRRRDTTATQAREVAELLRGLPGSPDQSIAQQIAFLMTEVGSSLAGHGDGYELWHEGIDRLRVIAAPEAARVPSHAMWQYHHAMGGLLLTIASEEAVWRFRVTQSHLDAVWARHLEAVAHFREAARYAVEPLKADAWTEFAQAVAWYAEGTRDPVATEEALTAAREALRLGEGGHRETRAWALIAVGLALKHRYRVTGNPADLREAIEVLHKVDRAADPADADSRGFAAQELGDIHFHLGEKERCLGAYATGLRLPGLAPERRIRLARRRAECAAEYAEQSVSDSEWSFYANVVADAYVTASLAAASWSRAGLTRRQREMALAEAAPMDLSSVADAAYWLVRLGRPEAAVEHMEDYLGALLSARLRDEAVLGELRRLGRADLADRLARLNDELVDVADPVRTPMLQREMSLLREEIVGVTGLDPEQTPTRYADLAAAAPMPVVYLVAGRSKGYALIVGTDSTAPAEVGLPGLTGDVAGLFSFELAAATAALRENDTVTADAGFDRLADELTRLLLPLADRLTGSKRVAVVPCGPLALLPIHVALGETGPTVGYVTNARALVRSSQAAGKVTGPMRVLGVGDDGREHPEVLRLRSPEAHLDLIPAEFRGDRLVYDGAPGFPSLVSEAMSRHEVFHFSCHGVADFANPLDSRLLLGDGTLTVRDVLRLRLSRARLALITACESATAHPALPDEQRGLPAGLVEAGVPGVVATMWRVDELPAALFTARFYEVWRETGDPAIATARAAWWLRAATRHEINARYGHLDTRRRRGAPPRGDERPYEDPRHWAAYCFRGI